MLAVSEKVRIFAPVKRKGRVAQLNRVADYGSAGYRFESCRGHSLKPFYKRRAFFISLFSPSYHFIKLSLQKM